jgi:hypothetical protein
VYPVIWDERATMKRKEPQLTPADLVSRPILQTPTDKARWLSEFLTYDIETMPRPDFVKLDMEFFYFLAKESTLGDFTFVGWSERREQLKSAQGAVREILSGLVSHRDSGKTIRRKYTIEFEMMIADGSLFREYVDDSLEGLENLSNILAHEILGIFLHLPLSAIKQCGNIALEKKGKKIPEQSCDNLFIQFAKREKIFCSSRCASRHSARKVRQKDPEGYRKKQKRIMKKRYREKTLGGEVNNNGEA